MEAVAGNGLLHRRLFLTQSASLVGAGGIALLSAQPAGAEPLEIPPWMKAPGAHMSAYGQPSQHEARCNASSAARRTCSGSGVSFTPHHRLHGTITPNSLHFERHHSGVPEIDPDAASLLIHGAVRRPLTFTVDALLRYPTVSRIQFLECSGNSGTNLNPQAPQAPAA